MFTHNTLSIGNKPIPNILVSCDHGLMIVNRFDNTSISVGLMVLDHGNNNTVEADLTMKSLSKVDNPIVFDVGSNIGTYATWVAKWAAEKNGKVYCFEPQRIVFQMLCGNMSLNNIFNVYAHNIALGDEEKIILMNEPDYTQSGSFAAFSLDGVDREKYNVVSKQQSIQMTTVDNFVSHWNIPKVDFIKVDAEGFDMEVLYGAKNVIEKFKPDLFVEYLHVGPTKKIDSREEGKNNLTRYLNNIGYNTYILGDNRSEEHTSELQSH